MEENYMKQHQQRAQKINTFLQKKNIIMIY